MEHIKLEITRLENEVKRLENKDNAIYDYTIHAYTNQIQGLKQALYFITNN